MMVSQLQKVFLLCLLLVYPIFTLSGDFLSTHNTHVDEDGYHHNHHKIGNNLGRMGFLSWLRFFSSVTVKEVVNGLMVVLALLCIIVYRLRKLQEASFGKDNKSSSLSSDYPCLQFSFAEIKLATNNFDQRLVIGKGGFGTVYKGLLDHGASSVAIKRLEPWSRQGAPEFWAEVKMLSKLRHSHLVSLIGFCDEFNEMILVYEYVENGNLEDHLSKKGRFSGDSPLSWVQRLKICIGAARALDYLHTGTGVQQRVIHRDVKSSNILLDRTLAAKLSDFGVSRIGPANQPCTHVSTEVKGSFGYFDPEYVYTGRLTRKSDVYSFGVVLLEVLTGRRAVDLSLEEDQHGLVGWAKHCIKEGNVDQIVDEHLKGKISPKCLKAFLQTVEKCLKTFPQDRPTMAEVILNLESVLALQEKTHIKAGDAKNNQSRIRFMILTFSRMLRNFFCVEAQLVSGSLDDNRNDSGVSVTSSIVAVVGSKNICVTGKLSDETCMNGEVTDRTCMNEGLLPTADLKIFTFSDLKSATRNFRSDCVLGEGGFGTVYKGWVEEKTLLPSRSGTGMAVAIKKLNPESMQGFQEWQSEVNFLGRLFHPNLVKLLGCCVGNKDLLLVYEFMQKGSLENHLFRRSTAVEALSWDLRIKIAIDAARGLAFLHSSVEHVIYRDFKASNILLDGNYNAKISDFGLAKMGPSGGSSHVTTMVMGTYGYAAPEYVATGHLYVKSDVYGYGVVLLEIMTGLRALDTKRPAREQNLVDWAKPLLLHRKKLKTIMDARIEGQYSRQAAQLAAQLTLRCLEPEPRKRPDMKEVVEILEQINAMSMKVKPKGPDISLHLFHVSP